MEIVVVEVRYMTVGQLLVSCWHRCSFLFLQDRLIALDGFLCSLHKWLEFLEFWNSF